MVYAYVHVHVCVYVYAGGQMLTLVSSSITLPY